MVAWVMPGDFITTPSSADQDEARRSTAEGFATEGVLIIR
jgi:hypothetical protein